MALAVHRPHVPHLSQPGDTRHPLEAALAGIEDDATGEDWEKPVVEVTPGGE